MDEEGAEGGCDQDIFELHDVAESTVAAFGFVLNGQRVLE